MPTGLNGQMGQYRIISKTPQVLHFLKLLTFGNILLKYLELLIQIHSLLH